MDSTSINYIIEQDAKIKFVLCIIRSCCPCLTFLLTDGNTIQFMTISGLSNTE